MNDEEFNALARKIAATVTDIYWDSDPIIWDQPREYGDDLEQLLALYNDEQRIRLLGHT